MNKIKQQALLQLLVLVAILIALNVLSSSIYHRFDLTKEKRFSLTQPTKDVLRELDDVVYFTVFLDGEFPAGFQRLRNATMDMLNEFRAYSGNYVEYQFVDPFEDLEGEERKNVFELLMKKGLSPTRLSVDTDEGYSEKIIFPGALAAYKGREIPITLLQEQLNKGPQETLNNSIALLEYHLANVIQKVQRPSKPTIAFLEGHGELPEEAVEDMAATLSRYYVLERFDITENLYIPPRISAVVIAKPTKAYGEPHKFKIDQYIMNGGSVLWLLENMTTSLDSLTNPTGSFLALDYGLNLEDQLFKYGFRINFDLVQDLQCTKIPLAIGTDQFGNANKMRLYNWMYFPVLTNHNNEHPVSKNLDAVLGQFVGTIDTIQTRKLNINKTVLMRTSSYSRTMAAPIKVDVNDVRRPNQSEFTAGEQIVGLALEGEFASAFKNRLDPSTIQMIDTIAEVSYREKSEPAKMVVLADGDLIRNEYDVNSGRPSPLGYYKFTKETFANKELILNAIEWLTDEKGIIAARSKDVKLRLLDKQRVKEEKLFWQLLNVFAPIVLVLLFGMGYNFWRRRRYGM